MIAPSPPPLPQRPPNDCTFSPPPYPLVQVREKIETNGRDARWEFPKQLLFARTNYMVEICNDIIEMVEIIDDFLKFLGPELKAVTGKAQPLLVSQGSPRKDTFPPLLTSSVQVQWAVILVYP